jgi:hypothetical protein
MFQHSQLRVCQADALPTNPHLCAQGMPPSMLQPLDEGDPAPSFTASSRSVKRHRVATTAAAATTGPSSSHATQLGRHLGCAALTAAAELAAKAAGGGGRATTTSNVGSSLLVDRTDSSEPQHSSDGDAEQPRQQKGTCSGGTTVSREVHRSDAPPPLQRGAAARRRLPSVLQEDGAVHEPCTIDLSRDSTEPPPAKRLRAAVPRMGPPLPLPPEALWVEDRESPPLRADDEDGHYQFEVGENFSRRCECRLAAKGALGAVCQPVACLAPPAGLSPLKLNWGPVGGFACLAFLVYFKQEPCRSSGSQGRSA